MDKREALLAIVVLVLVFGLAFEFLRITGFYAVNFSLGGNGSYVSPSTEVTSVKYYWNSSSPIYDGDKLVAECSEWGFCERGMQKRSCVIYDSLDSIARSLETTKTCNFCLESWVCGEGACVNGHIQSSCIDLNKCGTSRDIISSVPCSLSGLNLSSLKDGDFSKEIVARREAELKSDCQPSLRCTPWTKCSTDYSFDSFSIDSSLIQGSQGRECFDLNKCIDDYYENRKCYTNLDTVSMKITKCGKEYTAVYDKAGNLLSVMDDSRAAGPKIDISLFSENGNLSCSTCSNGIKDGNEWDVDCGGSCKACVVKSEIGFFARYGNLVLWGAVILFVLFGYFLLFGRRD